MGRRPGSKNKPRLSSNMQFEPPEEGFEVVSDGVEVVVIGAEDTPPPPRLSYCLAEKRKVPQGGHLTKYSERWDRLGNGLALSGFTRLEMAAIWGIKADTIYKWEKDYPSFARALEAGWNGASVAVVRALYKRATGYTITRRKTSVRTTDRGTETLEEIIVEEVPADVGAIGRWLKCRLPTKWGEAAENPDAGEEAGEGKKITLELKVVRNDQTNYLAGRALAEGGE